MQYIGQHKSAALLSSFLTFSHHSTLRNLAFWMMRISHSGSKLKTDYDFFQLFAYFSLSYPLIPSIYKDIYHLAQRIINPLVLVL